MRVRKLLCVLGLAGPLLLGCGGGTPGTGVTVSGKAKAGLDSRTFTTLSDDGMNQVGCLLSGSGTGTIGVEASLDVADADFGFQLALSFDEESLEVAEAALTVGVDGQETVGEDCTAELTSYGAGTFTASVTCATSSGGSDSMVSLEAEYTFCQLGPQR